MDPSTLFSSLWGAAFIILIVVIVFAKRRRRRIGSAASGTMYEWETRDRRRAIEIIVEERAEARDPEDAEGNLPELERPGPPRRHGGPGLPRRHGGPGLPRRHGGPGPPRRHGDTETRTPRR